MDHLVPASFLPGSYGDSLSQGHHQYQPPCPPPATSSSCLYKARPQSDAHWALGSATLLYPGSCSLLAGLGATSGLGAGAATDASCVQGFFRPCAALRREGFRTQGRDTHEDPGLKREEMELKKDPDRKIHKRRHTRPTFSGYQVFVLEKAFEQNRYLSSMEKQQLALSLGMTISQVKVWFQNRRTKWRKTVRSEPQRTWVKPAGQEPPLDGDYDKPLDPNNDDDRVHRLLQRHGKTSRCPAQLSALQMATADQTIHTQLLPC